MLQIFSNRRLKKSLNSPGKPTRELFQQIDLAFLNKKKSMSLFACSPITRVAFLALLLMEFFPVMLSVIMLFDAFCVGAFYMAVRIWDSQPGFLKNLSNPSYLRLATFSQN